MAWNLTATVNRYLTESEPEYTKQKKYYEDAHAKERAAMDAVQAASDTSLKQTRDNALRQAYVSRRQNERSMPATLAAQGINGGMAETTASSILRGYQNARNAANSQYSQDKTTLDTNYNANVATLGSKYAQYLADLETRRRDDALAKAQIDYQQYQAAEDLRLQREQLEQERKQQEQALKLEQERWAQELQLARDQFAWEQQQAAQAAAAASGGGSSGGSSSSGGGSSSGSRSSSSGSVSREPVRQDVGNYVPYQSPGYIAQKGELRGPGTWQRLPDGRWKRTA